MITPDGWLDWAARTPGPDWKRYPDTNAANIYIPHSAVGYLSGWLKILHGSEEVSCHGWISYDGTVIQHYPFTASCWSSGSREINTRAIAFENEGGPPGNESEPLTEGQIRANVRIIFELAAWKGWAPRRPANDQDKNATLYEHRECVRFGAAPTACPSGRIDWGEIIRRLEAASRPNYTIERIIDALTAGLACTWRDQTTRNIPSWDWEVLHNIFKHPAPWG